MLKSSLCDYSDGYILVIGRTIITGAGDNAVARQTDESDKAVMMKHFSAFINCKSEINNTEIDNVIYIVMHMYNSKE